ncbi:MAG TPA: iron ABC transporter, partial [Verrucomicrobiales bacterium]|nr:iron ABC transporter [Verrucomicrobiales bacterium]
SGWLGSSLSALFQDLPTGAVIVLVGAAIFTFSLVCGSARGILPRFVRQTRLKRKVGRQHLLRAIYEILESRQLDNLEPVSNLSIDLDSLTTHRSWSYAALNRLLRTARAEDHLEKEKAGRIRLSEAGFGEASRVTRNHRLWELYLIRHADIAPSHVDRDADLVEHVLDADVVQQLEMELQGRPIRMDVPPSPHLIDQSAG